MAFVDAAAKDDSVRPAAMPGLHHDFSNGDPLSREEIQVLSVLDLPACSHNQGSKHRGQINGKRESF